MIVAVWTSVIVLIFIPPVMASIKLRCAIPCVFKSSKVVIVLLLTELSKSSTSLAGAAAAYSRRREEALKARDMGKATEGARRGPETIEGLDIE